MSNRLLQAPSPIGWLLQLLLPIGWMTECRRVAQVQNITPLIWTNYKQVCQQRRQERWLSKKEVSSFWGRGIVTGLNTFNKFCLVQFYNASLDGHRVTYNCNFCILSKNKWQKLFCFYLLNICEELQHHEFRNPYHPFLCFKKKGLKSAALLLATGLHLLVLLHF